jgi:hypothetical protein
MSDIHFQHQPAAERSASDYFPAGALSTATGTVRPVGTLPSGLP